MVLTNKRGVETQIKRRLQKNRRYIVLQKGVAIALQEK